VRIGTASEKDSVEKEIQELKEKLAQVESWKSRRQEIETELNKVWVKGEDEPLRAPEYQQQRGVDSEA
jgi:ATP-binding cassette subfamily D (ALD) long-chain fatty acid import protein